MPRPRAAGGGEEECGRLGMRPLGLVYLNVQRIPAILWGTLQATSILLAWNRGVTRDDAMTGRRWRRRLLPLGREGC